MRRIDPVAFLAASRVREVTAHAAGNATGMIDDAALSRGREEGGLRPQGLS
jgi:hypothetical protein